MTQSVSSTRWSLLALIGVGVVAAAVAFPTTAAADEHYVETARELYDAARVSEPGDEIVMANGTWTDAVLHFVADGVEGDSIRLRAETPGKVVLTGESKLLIGGDYLVVSGLLFKDGALEEGEHVIQFRDRDLDVEAANHSRVTNTAIIDYNPENRLTQYKWISLYGTHNRVDHSYFAGKTHDGATMVVWLEDEPEHEPNYHRIDHNHFGPRPELGKNGGETIRIGTSSRSMQSSRTTVEYNLFEETDGETEIISNKSGDNVYRYNTFFEAAGTLTLRHGNRATVRGNFFIGNGKDDTGGVRVIGEDHVVVNNYFENLDGSGYRAALAIMNGVPNSPLNRYFQVKNAVIAHNTFVNCRYTIGLGVGADAEKSLPPKDVTFVNNVVQISSGRDYIDQEDEPVDMTWAGNVMHGGDLGIDDPGGITFVDPELAEEGGLWRPQPGSPLIDAAAEGYLSPDEDMDGQLRDDSASDVGADEVVDAPVRRHPLTENDVGLSWSIASSTQKTDARSVPFDLEAAYPNPFRRGTTLTFSLEAPGRVIVEVHDVMGRRVATLLDESLPTGTHQAKWKAREAAAGLYVVTLKAHDQTDYRTVLLTR